MSGGPVRSLQAFITTGAWPTSPILQEMRRVACSRSWPMTTRSGTPTRPGSPRRGPSRSASNASTPAPWGGPTIARSPSSPTTLGEGPHLHGPAAVPARGMGRRRRPPRGGRCAAGGDLPHQAAIGPGDGRRRGGPGGAVPLGRRRRRLRRQPEFRAGGAPAGQVVRPG